MSSTDDDRARLERLIAAADRVASQPIPPEPERPSRVAAMAALAIVGVGALVLGVKLAAGSDAPQTTAAAQTTAVQTVPPSSGAAVTTTIPTVITLPPNSTGPATTVPASNVPATSAVTTTTWVPTPGEPVRAAVYLGGQVRLDGAVPDSRTATRLSNLWSAAFGKGTVTVTYTIANGVPLPTEEPLFAHEAMQFPPLSAELQPPAIELLDRLAILLAANPKVTLDIDAYTDDAGDNAANLQLTQFRAGAVVIYLVGKGIDPARLTGTGHGAASPVADNATEAGRSQNRRVEFTVHHLLD